MKGYGGFVKAVIASEVRNGFFNDDFSVRLKFFCLYSVNRCSAI